MSKHPFQLRQLIAKLKSQYGIEVSSKRERGKGSEIILLKPEEPGSKKGEQYPLKDHGASTEISIPVVNAILRRFRIDKKEFWGNKKSEGNTTDLKSPKS